MEILVTILVCLCLGAAVFHVFFRHGKEASIPMSTDETAQEPEPMEPAQSVVPEAEDMPAEVVKEAAEKEATSKVIEEPTEEETAPEVVEESAEEEPLEGVDETEIDEQDEKAVTQNTELIAGLHKVLEQEKVFLKPDIHIDDVAKMLLTNRTYITRLMRQEYGLTFIEYVNVARIQYAQSLLYTTRMTLEEVSEKAGFQSTSNFCRAFKRYTGTTPKGWKQTTTT